MLICASKIEGELNVSKIFGELKTKMKKYATRKIR